MAIYRIFKTGVFEPEAITIMSAAYEDALRVLQLANREDPLTETVARKIIQVSGAGEKDPIRIRELALQSLGITPAIIKPSPTNARQGDLKRGACD